MSEIKNKFDRLVKELEENKKIEVVHLRWKPSKPVTKNDPGIAFIKKFIKSNYQEELPEDFVYGIEVCSNTHICWRGEYNGQTFWGEMYLTSILDLYAELPGGIQIEHYHDLTTNPDLKKISPIDYHREIGDIHGTYYDRTNGQLLFQYKWDMYKLNLSHKEYLDQLCKTRGIAYWPFFFTGTKPEYPDQALLDKTKEALSYFFGNE